MAVRHGYGKIAGTDALVFAYDTGDTRNSYKGEPTVNHISGGSNVADCINGPINYGAQGGVTVVATIEYYSEKRPHVFRIKSTNDTGYNMINQQSSIQNQSGTTYTYSYDFKQLRGSTQQDSSCTVYGNGYKSPDSSGYSSNVSIVNTPLEDGWTRRAITYTATYTGYNWYRFNLWTGGARADGTGDFEFLFDNFQIETNSHATPFTNNTRSATEGLLDLTGNSTIDLTSAGFDVFSDITFDGTDDYIDIGSYLTGLDTSILSIELVFRSNIGTGAYMPLLGWMENEYPHGYICTGNFTGHWGNESISFYNEGPGTTGLSFAYTNGHAFLNDSNYHHVVFQLKTSEYKIYVDGSEVPVNASFRNGSMSTTMPSNLFGYGATPSVVIGAGSSPAAFANARIPVVKIYNRVLTATEVAQNYGHYKTRFNIS